MPASRLDLAQLSYGEVLDATKHQDDKIGRLLGAVAFLTGGALVFADPKVLAVSYSLAGRRYPLTAVFLGLFLLVDLIAVVLWILTMSTPLTYPRLSSGGERTSYLFFLRIADRGPAAWEGMWKVPDLEDEVTADLIDETENLAGRAADKYRRSQTASGLFVMSVLFLVPALMLSLDTTRRKSSGVIPWDPTQRWLVALSVGLVVLVLRLWGLLQLKKRPREVLGRTERRARRAVGVLVLSHPALVVALVVSVGRGQWASLGVLVTAAAGVLTVGSLWQLAPPGAADFGRGMPAILGFIGWLSVAALTAFGVVVIVMRRPDLQLLLAMFGAFIGFIANLSSTATRPDGTSAPVGASVQAS